jgi:phosphoglycerate dehydrogenase-like enzyme
MGMDVIAYTASPRKTPDSKKDTGYIVPGTGDPDGTIPSAWYSGTSKASIHTFLAQEIDLLVISVPLTKATTHLLSTEEFELLHKSNSKKGTYVANIARGPIIDSKALITALEKGQISGAALDVTDPEPLPKEDPLWDTPNVLITPHVSGSTDRYADRAFEVLIENIRRERSGGELINEVDRERGY